MNQGLYDSRYEHDSCGFGFVCNVKGEGSHKIIQQGIDLLTNLNHRTAVGDERNSGDGAGIMFSLPHDFFVSETEKLDFTLPTSRNYGVGQVMFFDKHDSGIAQYYKKILKKCLENWGMKVLGWRFVPTAKNLIGNIPAYNEPNFEQVFVKLSKNKNRLKKDPLYFERRLFLARRQFEKIIKKDGEDFKKVYICSLSTHKIVYKGQLVPIQVGDYFLDLKNPLFTSHMAMVHGRFSTNTLPRWDLAHPFRFICHNGEINTLRGNKNKIKAGRSLFCTPLLSKKELKTIIPVIEEEASDSATFDHVAELLTLCGRSVPHVIMMMIPEAWENDPHMEPYKKHFYEFHAAFSVPWDGPAAVAFCDGRYLGGILDRNGLRPSRYTLYTDNTLVVASEAGVLDKPQKEVLLKNRLAPGKMLLVDFKEGRIIPDEEIKKALALEHDYGKWLENKININDIRPANLKRNPSLQRIRQRQITFGYTQEDLRMILSPMFNNGEEPVGSMGTDTPLAVLSDRPHNLFNYFYQLFAQVTNPPIDSIRENFFMSLKCFLGPQRNLLHTTEKHAHVIELATPILIPDEIEKMRWVDEFSFQAKTIPITFYNGEESLSKVIDRICRDVKEQIDNGYKIIILSDRIIDSAHPPLPSLLAISAVHHYLIRAGKRSECSLVIETGEARTVHHFAVLLSFGADAISPYTVFDSIDDMKKNRLINPEISYDQAVKNFVKAVNKGLLKIISKMGISTIRSYIGAQIFEAVGINEKVVKKYFTGTPSRIGGIGLTEIRKEVLLRHSYAYFGNHKENLNFTILDPGGHLHWRLRGEFHLNSPAIIHELQTACRFNDVSRFKKYSEMINQPRYAGNQPNSEIYHSPYTLRGLLDFIDNPHSIPLEKVESIENIMTRFVSGAMSYGSLSWEAHTTLAIAMNRIGARSNTGEGGEDPIRYQVLKNGDSLRSAIKQVASGRFGVTAEYLINADEIQIKMAQGAKPGEGGQLPGHKVDAIIAKVRHSTPGVTLISPPPHHDIYSIEDLAQLIYDLKCANDKAKVSVKLVASVGVGTIAAGVAKAYADLITIAGYDGGTGASPISSIKHAGIPWELGITETHQVLVRNKLRSRVKLQTDGQIRTGKDMAIATLLGAEEWGVATAALEAMGCIMMRKCHLNTCPVGITTQRKELRELFTGEAEHVVNMFRFMAEEMREIMAYLGMTQVQDMVGRVDLLRMLTSDHWKASTVHLKNLLQIPKEIFSSTASTDYDDRSTFYASISQYPITQENPDHRYLKKLKKAIQKKVKTEITDVVRNTDRAFGTIISSRIAKLYGSQGLPEDTIIFHLRGSAGQSFAAFSSPGLTFYLEGEANDYFGKGLSGAKIILKNDRQVSFNPSKNVIVGNVAFYGATGGEVYIGGLAGERFCVRNSGVEAVVEAIGAHGCEYMTGGRVIILGSIGSNFAAGMSGGVAYIYDPGQKSHRFINTAMVLLEQVEEQSEVNYLNKKIQNHISYTGSQQGKEILKNWKQNIKSFVKVMPIDYKRTIEMNLPKKKGFQSKQVTSSIGKEHRIQKRLANKKKILVQNNYQ